MSAIQKGYADSSSLAQVTEHKSEGISSQARKDGITRNNAGQRHVDDIQQHNYLTISVANYLKRNDHLAQVADAIAMNDRAALKTILERTTPSIHIRETILAFYDEHTASESHKKHTDECHDNQVGHGNSLADVSNKAIKAGNETTARAASKAQEKRNTPSNAYTQEDFANRAAEGLNNEQKRILLSIALEAGFSGSLIRQMSLEWGIHPPVQTPVINQNIRLMQQQFADTVRRMFDGRMTGKDADAYLRKYDDEKEQRKIAGLLEKEADNNSQFADSIKKAADKNDISTEVIIQNAARTVNVLSHEVGIKPELAITVLD